MVGDVPGGRKGIVPYDSSWPLRFAAERARLRGALGERAAAIEHIGSTAVPGLAGVPAIDVAIALTNLLGAADAVPRLQALGYERVPARDLEGRFFLRRQPSVTRAFHVSLTATDAEFWRWCLVVRDRLRADPALAREFVELKRRAFVDGATAYAAAKLAFAERVVIDLG